SLAARREYDVDWIVHAAGHDGLDGGAVRPTAENMRGFGDERPMPLPLVGLLGKRALAPVNPPVRAEIWAVNVVGAVGQRLSLEPLAAPIDAASSGGIGQLPNARRRADIERAGVPHRPFGKTHLICKRDGFAKDGGLIRGIEPNHAMRLGRELLR